MRLPKRLDELLRIKEEYINAQVEHLNRIVVRHQNALLTKITSDVITLIEHDGGVIRESVTNYRLLGALEGVYKKFTGDNGYKLGADIKASIDGIMLHSDRYFHSLLSEEVTAEILQRAASSAKRFTYLSLGLTDGGMARDGFLDKLITNDIHLMEIKQALARGITGRQGVRQLTSTISEMIAGSDKRQGGWQRTFNLYARDIYSQHDAAYNKALADKLELKYFIYSGGLVRDSRDFCVAHNGKVYTTEETKNWPMWTVAKGLAAGEFREGYEPKEKEWNWHKVPSYMSYEGYQPLIDRGGYRCRHMLGYITEKIAMKLRPNLKKDER